MDLLSIKAEPEDASDWDENRNEIINNSQKQKETFNFDNSIRVKEEPVASFWAKGSQNGFKEEEASDPYQGRGLQNVVEEVPSSREEDEFLAEQSENRTPVVKTEDSELGDQGCDLPPSGTHQISSIATTSSGSTDPWSSLSGFIPTESYPHVHFNCFPKKFEGVENAGGNNDAYKNHDWDNNPIKTEPEDTPSWDRNTSGIIDQQNYTTNSKNAGDSVTIKTEPVSPPLLEDSVNEFKKEPSYSSLEKCSTLKIRLSVNLPVSLGETSKNHSSLYSFSSELISNGDDCMQLNQPQQPKSLSNGRERSSDHKILQAGNKDVNSVQIQGLCAKSAIRKSQIEERNSTNKKCVTCWFCKEFFSSKKTLKKHQVTCIGLKSFTCQFCGKSFKSKLGHKIHEMKHRGEKPYKCQVCGKPCCSLNESRQHEKKHTGEKPHKCQFCGRSFRLKSYCKNHERTHTGEKPFKCNFCKKAFRIKYHRTIHERTHTGEKSFKCQFCEKAFRQKKDCRRHEKIHTGEKPYKCQFCEKAFSLKEACKIHEMTHTGKPFKCQVCQMTFAHKHGLTVHEMIHTGKKPFKCQFCEKSFAMKRSVYVHEKIHNDVKPFKCQFCDMCFRNTSARRRHEKSHTGDKPHKCRFCKMSFIRKEGRRAHEMTHTGEKPFKCQFCEKCFRLKVSCTRHEMSHTGNMPFKCQVCEKLFTNKRDCQRHGITHTGEKPFKCKVCGKSFGFVWNYKKHLKTHSNL